MLPFNRLSRDILQIYDVVYAIFLLELAASRAFASGYIVRAASERKSVDFITNNLFPISMKRNRRGVSI